jgi:hypothetical protein
MNSGGKSHYCEITGEAHGGTQFHRGQASSYRVAAERAVASLICFGSGGNGQAGEWRNVTIRTGRVGG